MHNDLYCMYVTRTSEPASESPCTPVWPLGEPSRLFTTDLVLLVDATYTHLNPSLSILIEQFNIFHSIFSKATYT